MTEEILESDLESSVEAARKTLQVEACALSMVAERLDGQFSQAVNLLLGHPGKIVIVGVGKSGHIGQKMASTLCSTGSPAVFLHAAEAVHGDLGVYSHGDPTILISKSGATAELLRLIPVLRQLSSPLIAILGNLSSPLAREADIVLDARVTIEADPLGIVPTASTIVAHGLGDALAAALMHAKRFTASDFARVHPAGHLGRSLLLQVKDVMHRVDSIAVVSAYHTVRDVVIAMTERPLGAACVCDEDGILQGIVTDGDIRRALRDTPDPLSLRTGAIMTRAPVTVFPHALLREAAQLMEDRPSQLSVLPAVDANGRCVGVIRIHDIYQAGLV